MRRYNYSDNNSSHQHNRWVISYADFITLLFAFFVMMYAVTIVNDGDLKILSNSINEALYQSENQNFDITAKKNNDINISTSLPEIIGYPILENKDHNIHNITIEKMAESIKEELSVWTEIGLINIKQTPLKLEIEVNASVFFKSGSARIAEDARSIIEIISLVLKDYNNAIHVEGFTDNQPIKNTQFPSNWELSSARASSVVRMFAKNGINPKRMAAIGYGEFKPLTNNNTISGRNKNRRIVIVALASKDPKKSINIIKK